MKTNYLFLLVSGLATFGAEAFGAGNQANPVLPPSNAVVLINVVEGMPTPSRVSGSENPNGMIGSARWIEIKDVTYPRRAEFFAGLNRLEAQANAQFNELFSQRAAIANPAEAKVLDLALEKIHFVQLRLKFAGEALRNATPEMWNERKAQVGQAWASMQDALILRRSPSS